MSDYPAYNPNNLKLYFSNEEFIQKTIAQIRKDLNQFGYEFEPNLGEIDLIDGLIHELKPIISDFIEHHGERFMAYLYQVDISETNLSSREYGEDHISNICFKILKREAQKIYFQFLVANKKI